jgi:hypothetical protein
LAAWDLDAANLLLFSLGFFVPFAAVFFVLFAGELLAGSFESFG